jgi:Xaa-Pro aminopeptidase
VNHLIGYSRYFGSPAAAVISADGTRSLIVARDEAEGASAEGLADHLYSYGERGFGLVPDQTPLLADALAAVPEVADASRAGFSSELPHLRACLEGPRALPLVDAGAELARIRLVKDEAELVRIERSYELAWMAQETVRTDLRAGVTEIELFTSALASAQLAAGTPIEFAGDLLSGVRTADVCAPIRVAAPVAVKQDEAVVSDLVVGCDGYWGDTAATLIAGANEEVAGVVAGLLEILDKVAMELVPRRTGAEVYESMRALIEGTFEGGEFPHHGGHGVGLSSYEDPHVIPSDSAPLQAGMTVALEPGVYFRDRFGARVEQMYVVTEEGGLELGSFDETGGRRRNT